jgi:hypothetical protein
MVGRRSSWVAPENFDEKYVAYYTAKLRDLPDDFVIAFSHARREDKEETRSSRIVCTLDNWSVRDIPLWLGEDVPHDRQGLFRGCHYQAELARMRSAASPMMHVLVSLVLSGRVVSVGYAAERWLQPLFPQEVESGLLPNVPHYCRLASNAESCGYFHSVFAQKLGSIGKPFLTFEALSAQLSAQLSVNMIDVWSGRSPEERTSIGQKISHTKASLPASWKAATKARMLLAWSNKSDEEIQAIGQQISQTKCAKFAAMSKEQRAAFREKRTLTLKAHSSERRSETRKRFHASMAGRTTEQRDGTRKKWQIGFMARRTRWIAALRASLAKRTSDTVLHQEWIVKLRAGIAKRTPEEWARRYALLCERHYSRPEWSLQHSLQVKAMHARKSPEARALENAKHKATCAGWTEEFREQRIANMSKAIAERTDEASMTKIAKFRATQAAKTQEEVASSSVRRKAAAANMTEETRASKSKKIAEIRANATQEQKDAFKIVNMKAIADKKDKEAAEQMQRLQAGTMTPEERFRIVKNGKSRSKYQSENSSASSSNALDDVYKAVQAIYAEHPSLVQSDLKSYKAKQAVAPV